MRKYKSTIYQLLRLSNDINAVRKGRIHKRIFNKLLGRFLGKFMWR